MRLAIAINLIIFSLEDFINVSTLTYEYLMKGDKDLSNLDIINQVLFGFLLIINTIAIFAIVLASIAGAIVFII